MKKLIKNKICGSVNSTRMYCSRKTGQMFAATVHVPYMNSSRKWEKTREKKKKKENAATETQETRTQTYYYSL